MDEADETPENDQLVRVPRIMNDPFQPPEKAARVVVKRAKPDGSSEVCEEYDPRSTLWNAAFGIPISRDFILDRWGSGTYRLNYQGPDRRACGMSGRIELEAPEKPQKPARANGPTAYRPPPAPPPALREPIPEPPRPAPPAYPPVPPGTDAATLLAIMSWSDERAARNAEERIARSELYWRQQVDTESMRHRRDLEDLENRYRRDREENEQRHRRFIDELERQHEATLRVAAKTSGREELEERLEEMEERLAAAKTDEGGVVGMLKGLASNPQGQQMLMGVLQQLAGAGAPKVGTGT